MKIFAQNKKARYDFFIEEIFEAGLSLLGTEVKSVKAGKVNLKESYIELKNGEVFVTGMNISPYDMASSFNHDPTRDRKLLLSKREISTLDKSKSQDGYTIVPTKIYANDRGFIKLEIAIAKGKKNYDKRQTIAKRDSDRRIRKALGREGV